jgi:serine/threonine-protein kinase
MAEVFLAQRDGEGARVCVVKRLLPQLAEDPVFVEMFRQEARLARRLHHPNLVAIDELGEHEGSTFVAMAYVDGLAVDALARRCWAAGRSLPLEVACCIAADVAAGLDHAHRLTDEDGRRLGLVHRDVSPDNVMVDREGNARLLDFGVAKSALPGDRTRTGAVKGKAPFLSPEQVVGLPLDGRADLHALGVTLYWLLTGRRPFAAELELELLQQIVRTTPRPPAEWNRAIPPVVNALVMQLLEKDRERRPSCGAEVRDRLAVALPARRAVVVPFVGEMAAAVDAPAASSAGTAGARASTPPHDPACAAVVPGLWRAASTPSTTSAPAPTPAATRGWGRSGDAALTLPPRAATTTPSASRAATTTAAPQSASATAREDAAAKGVVLAPMVARLKQVMKQRGLSTVPGLSDADLQWLRYQRVLATAYYPLDLYHRIVEAAHVVGWGGRDEGARQMGVAAATDALRGVYRVFLTEGDPARTLLTAPRMWGTHYRGSSAECARPGPNVVRITIRDYGPMPRALQTINLAWTETCARLAGAEGAEASGVEDAAGFHATVRWSAVTRR